MATLTSLVDRVRLELGDTAKTFSWPTIAVAGASRYQIPYSPVLASSIVTYVDGDLVDEADYEVEEHTGVLIFTNNAPDEGQTLLIAGSHFRFFTDSELESIVTSAANEHMYLKTDAFGRSMSLTNLPVVEEFPVALWATYKALMTLATDASFDIDISTPDGVHIPRSERYGQLFNMAQARKVQYDDLCKALNIGLAKIEVYTFRRISKATNRYIPVYLPQEIDDRAVPMRAYLALPTYGSQAVPSESAVYDIVFTQGDDWEMVVDFPFDITGYTFKAQARTYPGASGVIAEFTVSNILTAEGKITLSLDSDTTVKFPLRTFWDLQVTGPDDKEFTYVSGNVFAKRQVTQNQNPPTSNTWSDYGWSSWP